jgi:hypothetical protein
VINAQENKKKHMQAPKNNQGEKIEGPKNEGPVGEHFAQKNHSIQDMFFFAKVRSHATGIQDQKKCALCPQERQATTQQWIGGG